MNKRGVSFILLSLVLVGLFIGMVIKINPDYNIQGFKDKFNWTNIDLNLTGQNVELGNALQSMINGLGEAYFFVIKWVADLSTKYPNIPFKLLIFLVIFAIAFPFFLSLFKFTIILFILIKEFFTNKRERKELKRLKKRVKNLEENKYNKFWDELDEFNKQTNK